MPAPAVNTYTIQPRVVRSLMTPSWAPWVTHNVTADGGGTIEAMRCPAVVVNQRRADGTRPPSYWRKEWARCVFPLRSLSTEPVGDAWFLQPGSTTAIGRDYPTNQSIHPGLFWEHMAYKLAPAAQMEWYVQQVAKTKVLGKLERQKMDLGVTMLEMKQTIGFTTDLAVGILKGITAVVNSRRKLAHETDQLLRATVKNGGDMTKAFHSLGMRNTDILNAARDGWMGYQFGLKPLVYDVHNSFDALYTSIYEEKKSVLVKAKAGHSDQKLQSVVMPAFGTIEPKFMGRIRYSSEVHYSVTYEMPAGGTPTATLLGLDNAWSIGWEATKLSWMVDYGLGVGDWLRSFTAANGLLFREGSCSMLLRCVLESLSVEPPNYNTFGQKPSVSGASIEHGRFLREVLPPVGVVPGVVPQLKEEIGLLQLGSSLFALSHWLGGNSAVR